MINYVDPFYLHIYNVFYANVLFGNILDCNRYNKRDSTLEEE